MIARRAALVCAVLVGWGTMASPQDAGDPPIGDRATVPRHFQIFLEADADRAMLERAWALLRPTLTGSPGSRFARLRIGIDADPENVLDLLNATRGVLVAEVEPTLRLQAPGEKGRQDPN